MGRFKNTFLKLKVLTFGAFLSFIFAENSTVVLESFTVNHGAGFVAAEVSNNEELKNSESRYDQNEKNAKLKNKSEDTVSDSRCYAIDDEILQAKMKEMGIEVVE